MMVKFDENQILKNGEYIYAQRAEIEKRIKKKPVKSYNFYRFLFFTLTYSISSDSMLNT